MNMELINRRGLVLLGCGKMGSAMLEGWLNNGLLPAAAWVIDPNPSDWLKALAQKGLTLNGGMPDAPAVVLIAVKPQMMGDALPQIAGFGGGDTLIVTVAAGTTIATYEAAFGPGTHIVRAMPNTPASVGRGITAIVGNAAALPADLDLAEALLSAVGQVVRLDGEHQMDAVTAVSGSGPAYVFHLIEALAAAGEAEGLPAGLAMQLARATVTGAGELAHLAPETASQLRINVTSPGGTTAAALSVLMAPDTGFPALLRHAVKAAADRGRELGK
ncbi:MAG: pyrroline-5-carboxylate reductase [Pseudotabrizicola sp.]|uniref:pyrroline-5-carboxylate reductase n=1 Tax=Pseudotabrizicola sp. TaxID=2939647 RepID=UPI0027205362|nr:pyrroline-5-carboxylate reductase [Pseudotabrizicola sp.]MDO8882483.1 pyrroline-5-carboxylate reductase [Pseudotabrizicola sp.]MDP2080718.1 pyrroline-5-carboxylate reductase [Pseudotabrizicola sp.]MDZ7574696.1 pyrroline-5-carboxylate reductase [Pseudotabrizicola sp.]